MKNFAWKIIWSQPDTTRIYPPHSFDIILAWRSPMRSSFFIHWSSGFFRGHLFYNGWRGQSHKIGETWPEFTNSTAFSVMGMACFCIAIDGGFFIEDWEFPIVEPCFISSGCWMWEKNPGWEIYKFLSVPLHFILWPDAHLGASVHQIILQQDWSTLGMRYGR